MCIDIVPNTTVQNEERQDTLNIGGFSDSVFDVINDFVSGNSKGLCEKVDLVVI